MNHKKIKILFIDDEEAFLNVLTKRLTKRGFHSVSVNSGEAGLSELNRNAFDLVVLDVCMPGMDGIVTLKAIKKKWPFVEVILLTGHACIESARQGMDEGAFDYLMKPVEINELVYKLEDAYDKTLFLTKKKQTE
jgi:DNA-binding NtrC family response regulator